MDSNLGTVWIRVDFIHRIILKLLVFIPVSFLFLLSG